MNDIERAIEYCQLQIAYYQNEVSEATEQVLVDCAKERIEFYGTIITALQAQQPKSEEVQRAIQTLEAFKQMTEESREYLTDEQWLLTVDCRVATDYQTAITALRQYQPKESCECGRKLKDGE